ncbi:MAG: hypothetical protein IKS82_08310, partial [Bacteroidales bacterium]|nr:hypothetical protein [Bacteroidales bacterium]
VLLFSMDCVRLNVKTVPSIDPETHQEHIAYTVYRLLNDEDSCQYAAGWTLKDAIGTFCSKYIIYRNDIQLIRPFHPQILEWNESFWM